MSIGAAVHNGQMGRVINKRELAAVLGWSQPKLDSALLRDREFPVVKVGGHGAGWEFDQEAVLAYVRSKTAPTAASDDTISPYQRRTLAEAELKEIQVAQLKKELVPAEVIGDVLAESMVRLGAFLDSIPSRLRSEFQLPDDVTRKVSEWIDIERNQLVKRLGEVFE